MKTPEPAREKPSRPLLVLTGVGLELAGTLVLFLYAGFKLDQWLETKPALMVGGALLGIALGFYNLFRKLT